MAESQADAAGRKTVGSFVLGIVLWGGREMCQGGLGKLLEVRKGRLGWKESRLRMRGSWELRVLDPFEEIEGPLES